MERHLLQGDGACRLLPVGDRSIFAIPDHSGKDGPEPGSPKQVKILNEFTAVLLVQDIEAENVRRIHKINFLATTEQVSGPPAKLTRRTKHLRSLTTTSSRP